MHTSCPYFEGKYYLPHGRYKNKNKGGYQYGSYNLHDEI